MTPDPATYPGYRFPAEIISHAVWLYHAFGLSLRDVELILAERGITVTHESIRSWCRKFGSEFAARLRRRRPKPGDTWHLDEVFLRINGVLHYLWRAVDHEGEVLEAHVTERRDKAAVLKLLKKLMERHGQPEEVVTDTLRFYGAPLKELGGEDRRLPERWENNRAETSHRPFRRRERAMLRFRRMHSLAFV